jgi:hypothetical protein
MTQGIQLPSVAVEGPGRPLLDSSNLAIRTDAVYVVHTSVEGTVAALRVAGDFAKALHVPVTITEFRTFPDASAPCKPGQDEPLEMSAVETRSCVAHLRAQGLDIHVRAYVSRDPLRAVPWAFRPRSLIVVGGRRSWWPTEGERWRRTLEAADHFVVFVDQERFHA